MREQFGEVVAGELGEVHVARRTRRHGLGRVVAGPDHAPDAAAFAVHAGRIGVGVLVAGIAVVPIHHPHRAVGAGLGAHGHEPAVLRGHEVAGVVPLGRDKAGTLRREPVDVQRVLVDVPVQRRPEPFLGPLVALVDVDAGVGGHVVLVVHDARQLAVRVGERRLPGLARIQAAGREVEQVIDHAGADEGVALRVEIHAPRVAGAFGEHLELAGPGVEPGDAGAHHDRRGVRIARVLGLGGREDAVRHVELPVGAPGEAVEQLVPVFEAEAGEHLGLLVRDVVAVRVTHEPEMRGLAHVHAAVPDQQGGGERHAVGEDGHLVGPAVAVGVLEDLDAVAALLAGLGAERILIELQHPQASALVEGHRDRVDHLGLAGEETHLEAGRDDERFLLVRGREGGVVGRFVLARELTSRRRVGVDREAELGMTWQLTEHRGREGDDGDGERGQREGLHAGYAGDTDDEAPVVNP